MKAFEESRIDGFIRRSYTFFDPTTQRIVRVVFTFDSRQDGPRITAAAERSDDRDAMGMIRWVPAEDPGRLFAMATMFRSELEDRASAQAADERQRNE